MKLLIITQKVDKNDPVLGFFHLWLEEFSKKFEYITVICLEKGKAHLPSNIKVLSLGKEGGISRMKYVSRFYKYIISERNSYDTVFVHMNQEYVLLGGLLWKSWGKRVAMWRNHPDGSILTIIAVWLSDKVFATSPSSYVAQFKKTKLMPVGVDTDFFKPDPSIERIPNSVLFLGRISTIKKVLEFVEWFNALDTKFTSTIAGTALPKDRGYEELVKRRASDRIKFVGAVNQDQALKLYQSHEIYVNKTPPGSFDKTIVEAAACGMKLMVDNPVAQNIVVEEHSLKLLADKLEKELS